MTACGVWPRNRGLVAVVIDDAGHSRSCSVAFTDDARWGLVHWLAAARADLVVDEALLDVDPIADVARRAGVSVWIAGPPLVAALRHAAGITRRGAQASAALLARLPAVPWLREQLRHLEPSADERQIPLL